MQPDYIFETSWEVCNRVGGIYAVLSTRAASMQQEHPDKVVFFGPDFGAHSDLCFREDNTLLGNWHPKGVRIGRWLIPGSPIAVLLRWEHLLNDKNTIYGHVWDKYGVQSHAAYGDYDESCLFAWAVGQYMEDLYHYLGEPVCVAQANEWQTAFTVFYLREHCPRIGTLFTTHATSIGRSIAGNNKPLYDYFAGYHGDQMAEELNMVSKHSAEKKAAQTADCFTTVSDVTARECTQLLDRTPDIVTPNGFETDFVPQGKAYTTARSKARKVLLDYAAQHGVTCKKDTFLVAIAGRYEMKNKGIDVFLDAMCQWGDKADETVVAFVFIPYLEQSDFTIGNVHVLFVPTYLNGNDGVLNLSYYDLLPGLDLTAFPSYYEPWGYTPLESVAFHVPTITTCLSGFGVWAQSQGVNSLHDGVEVLQRTDSNYADVVSQIVQAADGYLHAPAKSKTAARRAAVGLSEKASWKHFFAFYRDAYELALTASQQRA